MLKRFVNTETVAMATVLTMPLLDSARTVASGDVSDGLKQQK